MFLDTDAIWGPAHARTHVAKAAQQRAVAMAVDESNVLDIAPGAEGSAAA